MLALALAIKNAANVQNVMQKVFIIKHRKQAKKSSRKLLLTLSCLVRNAEATLLIIALKTKKKKERTFFGIIIGSIVFVFQKRQEMLLVRVRRGHALTSKEIQHFSLIKPPFLLV